MPQGVAQACGARVRDGFTRRSQWGARASLACLEMERGTARPLLWGVVLSPCCVLGANPSAACVFLRDVFGAGDAVG